MIRQSSAQEDRGAPIRVDFLTFIGFVMSSGIDKVHRAEPRQDPGVADFWGAWRVALRAGVSMPDDLGDIRDSRKARIYPKHTAAYLAAMESAGVEDQYPGHPRALAFGELTVDVQPDVFVLVDGGIQVDVWCWHGAPGLAICSPERLALILAGARLAGFMPGVIDLQRGQAARIVREASDPPTPDQAALLFRAEAQAFVMFRRAMLR